MILRFPFASLETIVGDEIWGGGRGSRPPPRASAARPYTTTCGRPGRIKMRPYMARPTRDNVHARFVCPSKREE